MNTDLMDNVMSLLWHLLDALKESRQEVCALRRELGDRDRRIDELSAANSADAGLRQLQRESEDLGLYEPQSAHQHWPGQAQCEWCKGTGAIDAPTSADDPSCPNCDGEGRWEK